ncbi:hypothetical protein [Bradyrhizobium sp. LTSPM299]|jgi:hypothetical protein|uniref:hypothetical protein n=1 Tax=Bradyrhizobium sp. LTSPM299 TaxID=1619233 RepID=UPI0018CF5361|nr:hypothetical protein [Bradyrhizobium sp. LTSPM299]
MAVAIEARIEVTLRYGKSGAVEQLQQRGAALRRNSGYAQTCTLPGGEGASLEYVS